MPKKTDAELPVTSEAPVELPPETPSADAPPPSDTPPPEQKIEAEPDFDRDAVHYHSAQCLKCGKVRSGFYLKNTCRTCWNASAR